MAVLRIHAPVLGRQERVFEWDGRPISVGRDDACDVVLLEQAASRHHARFERQGDEVRVIDCDSANGVWVGDARVVGSRALHDGEVVRIGDTTLTLVLDPHRQATLYRTPVAEPIASGPTLAAPVEVQAPSTEPAPVPPAPVLRRPSAPVPAASSPSAYSLGSEPTLAAQSGPNMLGLHETSSPSAYSLGSEPTLAAQSGPNMLGLHETSSPSTYSLGSEPTLAAQRGPNVLGSHDRSAPSTYSLGEAPTLAPHVEPSGRPRASSESVYTLGHEPAATRETAAFGVPRPSSESVYTLGHEPAAAREPAAFGVPRPASDSVYSLGHEPAAVREPAAFVPLPSSGSVYSLGDAVPAEFRGPDGLPPAPSFDGAASSSELGAPPPRPGAMPPPAAFPLPPASPRPPVEPQPRPPAFVMPPQQQAQPRSAASSWEWSEPAPSEHRPRGRAAGPTLWLGLGLFIGGFAAMVIAVVAGYDPSELAATISSAIGGGGGTR